VSWLALVTALVLSLKSEQATLFEATHFETEHHVMTPSSFLLQPVL
jgi:hypothetical protein